MAPRTFNFRLITRDDSTAASAMPQAIFEPAGHSRDSTAGLEFGGCHMSEARNFRRWAAQVARQAGEEPDANEAQRLLSIAEYWVRLAEKEDWQRDRPGQDTSH
jgi:hypothetical protein